MVDQHRPIGKIHGTTGQGLVHRQNEEAVATNTRLVTQGFLDGGAQDNAHVLDGVVVINLRITVGLNLEVDEGVAAEERQHVVEEGDAGRDFGNPRAVQVDG